MGNHVLDEFMVLLVLLHADLDSCREVAVKDALVILVLMLGLIRLSLHLIFVKIIIGYWIHGLIMDVLILGVIPNAWINLSHLRVRLEVVVVVPIRPSQAVGASLQADDDSSRVRLGTIVGGLGEVLVGEVSNFIVIVVEEIHVDELVLVLLPDLGVALTVD